MKRARVAQVDAVKPFLQLARRRVREGKGNDPARVGAVVDEPPDALDRDLGFARAGACQD